LANESIVFELRSAILDVAKSGKPIKKNNIKLIVDSRISKISIEVIPINPVSVIEENYYLILFEDSIESEKTKEPVKKKGNNKNLSDEDSIQKLKEELTVTKEFLKSIIEEREAANEDLRSTLEELQSTNEELTSINEELETAKEELQSTNEELTTLNEELQNGNQELNQVNNDLVNLLSNVHIPIIILGGDLRIRRFTPSAEKVLNIISTDIGRPLSDLRINLSIGNLVDIINQVINTLESIEINVQVNEDHKYVMKIRPYKTLDNKIDGVIIAFLDNDDLRSKLFSVQAEM
jgi:two-component system CheB/CheR fusion protein